MIPKCSQNARKLPKNRPPGPPGRQKMSDALYWNLSDPYWPPKVTQKSLPRALLVASWREKLLVLGAPSRSLSSILTLSWPFFDVLVFVSDFVNIFNPFLINFPPIFKALGPSTIVLAPRKNTNSHFFGLLFSRTLFESQNDSKMVPKMTLKLTILESFLTPGPFPEAPGAFLEALKALPEPSGSSRKLLNN